MITSKPTRSELSAALSNVCASEHGWQHNRPEDTAASVQQLMAAGGWLLTQAALRYQLRAFRPTDRATRLRLAVMAQDLRACVAQLDSAHARECRYYAGRFGDGTGVLVSGCYRDHFPAEVKDTLRGLAHASSQANSLAFELWQLAGKRAHTLRRIGVEL